MADWIIVVDDDISNLKIAGQILSKAGIRVTALKSGNSLLDYVRHLSDYEILNLRRIASDAPHQLTRSAARKSPHRHFLYLFKHDSSQIYDEARARLHNRQVA